MTNKLNQLTRLGLRHSQRLMGNVRPHSQVNKTRTALVVAIFIVAGAGAANMFWRSKPKETVIEERFFRLSLPGQWSCQASTDPTRWTFRSDTACEQLTVSLFISTQHMSADEQITTLKRVTELRRRAETDALVQLGMPAVTLTDTTFAASGGVQTARYGGMESGLNGALLVCCYAIRPLSLYSTTRP